MAKNILFTVEKGRVLVPVGEPCPFGCRYCYTRGRDIDSSRVYTHAILERFRQFTQTAAFETIQFGYDGDPFARPARGIEMLTALAQLHKHINFSTKAVLHAVTLAELSRIHSALEERGKVLSAFVSLSCWDSTTLVEPHTPSAPERIATVKNLVACSIPVFIALRPILPHIANSEYERIVEEGIESRCNGFILGPLYADEERRFVRFLPTDALHSLSFHRGPVSWSAHKPIWTRYEDCRRLEQLIMMIEQKGGKAFVSSTDALSLLQRSEGHE